MTFDTALKEFFRTVWGRDALVRGGLRAILKHGYMRPPSNFVCDLLSLLRRIAHSQGTKELCAPIFLYNVCMRYMRKLIQHGVRNFFIVVDKGVHPDKLQTSIERAEAAESNEKTEVRYDEKTTHFIDGVMVTFSASTRRVVGVSDKISLLAVLDNRAIRAQFMDWFMDQLERESRAWPPQVTFVADWTFDRNKSPCEFIGGTGKRVMRGKDWPPNNWHEADHSIGWWVHGCMNLEGRPHTMVWAVDGDLLIVLLWVVYNYRRLRNKHTQKITQSENHSEQGYCHETRPLDAKNKEQEPSSEPRVVFLWEGPRAKDTLIVDINEAVTSLINRGLTPATIALAAMLTKNDYVKKEALTPGIGVTKIAEFLNSKRITIENFGIEKFKETVLSPLYAKSKKERPSDKGLADTIVKVLRCLERWRLCSTGNSGP
jgi:hypothetical protein